MPRFGALGRFFGKTVSEGAAFAAGVAVAPTLAPAVELVRQEAWQTAVSHNTGLGGRALDAGEVAGIVAEDVEREPWGVDEAAKTGINADRFAALLGEALNAPGLGTLFESWRRGDITDTDFRHGLRKAKLEPRWDKPLMALKSARLSPQEVALGIVRSVIKDPGLLVKTLDTSGSNVPQYEPLTVDPLAEAAAEGFDAERLRGLVGSIGLPMSAQQAASAYFRGIITEGAFNQAILEGDTRPEWASFILEQARHILTPHEYAELHLRGWIDEHEMREGAAKVGMTEQDADRVFLNLGRPLNVHQIATGLARGGTFGGGYETIPEPYQTAIRQSAIRPEWAALDYANRYTYPSAFVIRALVSGGDWTEAQGRDILEKVGWEPSLAALTAQKWASSSGSAAKEATAADHLSLFESGKQTEAQTLAALEGLGYPRDEAQLKMDVVSSRRVVTEVGKATTDLRKAFLREEVTPDVVREVLAGLGIAAWAVDAMLAVWITQKVNGFSVP